MALNDFRKGLGGIVQIAADTVGGFGAGLQGQGAQFLANQQNRLNPPEADIKDLSEERKQALLQDAFRVQRRLQAGDINGASELLMSRLENIGQLGGDGQHSAALLKQIQEDPESALGEVTELVDFAVASGDLKIPEGSNGMQFSIQDGQLLAIDEQAGTASASPIEGFAAPEPEQTAEQRNFDSLTQNFTPAEVERARRIKAGIQERPNSSAAQDRSLRERQLQIAESREQRQLTKLSAGLEKSLLSAQDTTVTRSRQANEFDVLAQDFETRNIEGGIKSTFSETLKGILGSQDDVSEFRRKFNQIRVSEGLRNLPPGTASDSDVKLALSGLPRENANPAQIASFLRGAAKLARFDASFSQFKADFISGKSTGKGLNRAWRSKVTSPANRREVSVSEIYATAQELGTTPEDIASQLGIEGDLF